MFVLIVRILLVLNGLLIAKLGRMYYGTVSLGASTKTLPVLANLLLPGIVDQGEVVAQILYPFLGMSYFALSAISLLAAATFGPFEASVVLLVIAIVIHIANSVMRLKFPEKLAKHYRQDIILRTLPEPLSIPNPLALFNHVTPSPPFIYRVTYSVGTQIWCVLDDPM